MSSILLDLSPMLKRDQKQIQEALNATLEVLGADYQEQYRQRCRFLDGRPSGRQSSIVWMLGAYFQLAGFLQVIITYRNRAVLRFGIELVPWEQNPEEEEDLEAVFSTGAKIQLLQRVLEEGDVFMNIETLVPADLLQVARGILDFEIIPILRNFFFNIPVLQKKAGSNLRELVEDRCRLIIQESLTEGRPVTLSHFRFQDMQVYFEMSGEHRTAAIIEEICDTIMQHLKKNDTLIRLSPISYLTISPGANRRLIEQRFESVYFQIHSLILDYDHTVYTVDALPLKIDEVWKALRI